MSQYWIPVNLTKREYVHPHKPATGLQLWEQVANHPGTGAALLVLCAAMPQQRGGGVVAPHPIIGRWAGDRVALVGDYAEDSDLQDSPVPASTIYGLCHSAEEDPSLGDARWTDVTSQVCEVLENELQGKYKGTGWRQFVKKS